MAEFVSYTKKLTNIQCLVNVYYENSSENTELENCKSDRDVCYSGDFTAISKSKYRLLKILINVAIFSLDIKFTCSI